MAKDQSYEIEADGLTEEQKKFIEETSKARDEMMKDPNLDVENWNTVTWNEKTQLYVPDDIPQR